MTAFAGFVDMLRLTADDGDLSRPVRCTWSVIGETLTPVRASCGVQITPWETPADKAHYDYVIVVGGLLHGGPPVSDKILEFIRRMAGTQATIVGLCTGTFAMMRAQVLEQHRVCVSWFHYWDFIEQFPAIDASSVIADRLFVIDRRRITCSGGRASIDVAAAILARHLDVAAIQKALRILQVDEEHKGNAPQPHPTGTEPTTHPKIKRAILLMEQNLSASLSIDTLAERVEISPRQLERLFRKTTGKSPQTVARAIRLRAAGWLLTHSEKSVCAIASACGFADASHLGREFRKIWGVTPSAFRRARAAGGELTLASSGDFHEVYPTRSEFY